ncbi:hypothetical protein [Natronomonas pharaonis]|nr:hypothetical protein [Natronomonas pharaonis]
MSDGEGKMTGDRLFVDCDPGATVTITDRLEGERIPRAELDLAVACDHCGAAIEAGAHVTLYASDTDYGPTDRDGTFDVARTYCAGCDRQSIRLPCRGAVEAVFAATVDDEWRLDGVELRDRSLSDDGVEWKPPAVWRRLVGVDLDAYLQHPKTNGMTAAPEDVYDTLERLGVDLSTFIEDGQLRLEGSAEKAAQETIEAHLSEGAKTVRETVSGR